MPATRAKKDMRSRMYVHPQTSSSKVTASTSTKNGRVQVHSFASAASTSQQPATLNEDIPSTIDDGLTPFHSGITIVAKTKKRYINSDIPLLTWLEFRDQYLDALLCHEGRGRYSALGCVDCSGPQAIYRCRDCSGNQLLCRECVERRHKFEPLHILEAWNTTHFQQTSLSNLGIRYQLGHPPNSSCPLPKPAHKDCLVIHNNGFHQVLFNLCGCNPNYEPYRQFLDYGWFPATPLEPRTCMTFTALRQFHTLNLTAKTTAYDFYKVLSNMTDATGLSSFPDCLQAFSLIVREWRHLKMAKRAGRGHDPTGIKGTRSGGFAVLCRACPHPNINLPPDWKLTFTGQAWINRPLFAMDCNFHLKNRLRASLDKDPALGPGYAYFVKIDDYAEHLRNYISQEESNHCVGFSALWQANNKKAKGLRATGVGSVSCARHEMFRPTGTGDLQKGERYCNMDYLLLSSLSGFSLPSFVISYDIACQWHRNFAKRYKAMPQHLQFSQMPSIVYKVPKFHLPSHRPECHSRFSLNFTPGVGRTDGEGVERNWSWMNATAASTSQMGPGSRSDMLDDFMGFFNYEKVINLGNILLRRLSLAIPEAVVHHEAFVTLTATLRKENAIEVDSWKEMVEKWEENAANPNPYDRPEEAISVSEIRRQLAEEEYQKVAQGYVLTEESPLSFIVAGLSIEDMQLSIRVDAQKTHPTDVQLCSLHERRTMLLKRIRHFQDLQGTFMPGLRDHLDTFPSSVPPAIDSVNPEMQQLFLPSSLSAELRTQLCIPGLSQLEEQLRHAQAVEALRDLRRQLRLRSLMSKYKASNVRSQGPYTRVRNLQQQIEGRITNARDRYRHAWESLVALWGEGEWQQSLKELRPEDIRCMNEREPTAAEVAARLYDNNVAGDEGVFIDINQPVVSPQLEIGEGHRTLSWIWYSIGHGEVSQDVSGQLHQSLCVEWVKARARALRWKEELILLDKEMHRVLAFGTWMASWWKDQCGRRVGISQELAEGLLAYAVEHAECEEARAAMWTAKWDAVCKHARVTVEAMESGTYASNSPPLVIDVEFETEDDSDDVL